MITLLYDIGSHTHILHGIDGLLETQVRISSIEAAGKV